MGLNRLYKLFLCQQFLATSNKILRLLKRQMRPVEFLHLIRELTNKKIKNKDYLYSVFFVYFVCQELGKGITRQIKTDNCKKQYFTRSPLLVF